MARQGLRALQTLPSVTDNSGTPSQKITYTKVGAKFKSAIVVPNKAVASERMRIPTATVWRSTRSPT